MGKGGNASADVASAGAAATAPVSTTNLPKRPIRGENVYGPYVKMTMTPWKNTRDEGRAGDPIDMTDTNEVTDDRDFMKYKCDARDEKTPDNWIPRDGRMVRLTGKHPFNAEPILEELTKHNPENPFITPGNLQIIRNHGTVPKLDWDTHKLSVEGPLVDNPVELSMDQLTGETIFPVTEFPISISCCGNRRKEMNMIKQTIGFNWGSAACGTMIYKGVLLSDILAHVGVTAESHDMETTHVEFIGSDELGNKCGGPGPFEDEPWGEKVKYATSFPLSKILDPSSEIMIAFMANGQRLHPDRGYPIRLIVPGHIGGRMIKWLAKIRVIPHESHSCYHYWDNKYLPPQVTSEIAAKDGWWYKQEYIINELSLNSFICKPAHEEEIPLAANIDKTMEVSGYAHSGGGRKVTRVEVSSDNGVTWNLAEITRHEKPNAYGKYWCWCWWKYQLPVAELAMGCTELWVRAWDTSNSPQPERPVWTLMGQSSNHVFRVLVHKGENAAGKVSFKFEHPTRPGAQSGGWATRVSAKVKSAGYGEIDLASYYGDE
mmetsp:Transcript_2098/g.4858  ORF Transcript_2098/g.4858 Transcript_2098/m.4858 type:complete len:545 (+) Transcript_2098:475-2109(+)|eukprot:CAMPEP_0113490750 /NCGR_PEP_ID=MMETSP0014_2-20120614/27206_1 /TAXON_ID=2857 /ORGANISM="Nitzschia sp." /LENGTH=544 /DNA_ID=CAMNT_0000384529 /DNA_START=296 /DNA_END=1930 /DNA_ORIENTATION=+ /assembly_acc=CAM_ASM_000159